MRRRRIFIATLTIHAGTSTCISVYVRVTPYTGAYTEVEGEKQKLVILASRPWKANDSAGTNVGCVTLAPFKIHSEDSFR